MAVRMASDLGQREGDILTVHRGQRSGMSILIRPQKTRRRLNRVIQVPLLPDLARMLDENPDGATVYVISEETGKPYKADNFRHGFAEIRATAGIDEIAVSSGLPPTQLLGPLSMLEIAGLVVSQGGRWKLALR